jgi:hypothetical protein
MEFLLGRAARLRMGPSVRYLRPHSDHSRSGLGCRPVDVVAGRMDEEIPDVYGFCGSSGRPHRRGAAMRRCPERVLSALWVSTARHPCKTSEHPGSRFSTRSLPRRRPAGRGRRSPLHESCTSGSCRKGWREIPLRTGCAQELCSMRSVPGTIPEATARWIPVPGAGGSRRQRSRPAAGWEYPLPGPRPPWDGCTEIPPLRGDRCFRLRG